MARTMWLQVSYQAKPFIILAVTLKRVTRWLCPSPRHSAKQHCYLRICWNGGEPFARLCKIWPVRDLNSRPPAHEASALTVIAECFSWWFLIKTIFTSICLRLCSAQWRTKGRFDPGGQARLRGPLTVAQVWVNKVGILTMPRNLSSA